MPHLVFLYNFICYSISFAAFFFAVVTAYVKKPAVEWRYVGFSISFLFLFIPSFIDSYFCAAGLNLPLVAGRLFALMGVLGFSLLIYTVPTFVRATLGLGTRGLMKIVLLTMAAVPGFATLIFLGTDLEMTVNYLLYIALVCSVVYTTVFGNYYGRRKQAADEAIPELHRWGRIFKGVSIATVVLIPLSVVFDMFPEKLGINLWPPLRGFRVYPLYYLIWNLLYVRYTLPLYLSSGEQAAAGPGIDHLSKREQEIARMLIQGLAYRDIADRLHISLSTAKTHIMRIYRKTGVGNKIELLQALSQKNPD